MAGSRLLEGKGMGGSEGRDRNGRGGTKREGEETNWRGGRGGTGMGGERKGKTDQQ